MDDLRETPSRGWRRKVPSCTAAISSRGGHARGHAQGDQTIRTPIHRSSLDLPDARVDSRVARDIDLALFGLLPAGQRLGGPVPRGLVTSPAGADGASPTASAVVSLEVDADTLEKARETGGLLLRDEELTPLARLDLDADATADARVEAAADGAAAGLVVGTLTRVRTRESGPGRQHAVQADQLWASGPRTVVVFGRPPVHGDAEALRHALAGRDGEDTAAEGRQPVLALVSDDPAAPVPTRVMLDVVRLWFEDLGLSHAEVRTAPLAWRDPESNAAVAARLGAAVGGSPVVFVDPDDGSLTAQRWNTCWTALEAGEPNGALDDLSPRIAARLQRWRPPRAERGLVLMFSGLSGSGKSTLARDVGEWVTAHTERTVSLLDGDVVRTMLSSGLGFSRADRELNVRRIGYVGAEIARHGGIAICAPIAPYAGTREAVRAMVRTVGDFLLVHVSTPLEACEARDLKGLYAKARAGLIPEFTGISDPYEEPTDAELRVDTSVLDRETALRVVIDHLSAGGWLPSAPPSSHTTARPEPDLKD